MSEVFVVHAPFMGVDYPIGVFLNLDDAMQAVRDTRVTLEGHQEQINVYKYAIGVEYNCDPELVHTSKM